MRDALGAFSLESLPHVENPTWLGAVTIDELDLLAVVTASSELLASDFALF